MVLLKKKKRCRKLTKTRLKVRLFYNCASGNLIWRTGPLRKRKAGSVRGDGYLKISIDNQVYTAHHLVWFYHHGVFPKDSLRFMDHNKRNTRIGNLKELIRKPHPISDNIPGVTYNTKTKEWKTTIKIKNRTRFLGNYETKLNAAIARHQGEIKHSFKSNSPAHEYVKKELPWY